MNNESFTSQSSSSTRLQKAISKNQIIDNDLKKELQHIDFKKKTYEKAFQQKRSQFLRKRLWLNDQQNLSDVRTSSSAENVLESLFHSRRSKSPARSKSKNNCKMMHKLSLDSNGGGLRNGKAHWKRSGNFHSSQTTIEKNLSREENLSVDDTPKTRLEIPHSLPPKFISLSEENLSQNRLYERVRSKSNIDVSQPEQTRSTENAKCLNSLLVPRLDKRFSRSDECLVTRIRRPKTPNENKQTLQTEGESSVNENSNCKAVKQKSTHLTLPPLTRPRSKSATETVIWADGLRETMPRCVHIDAKSTEKVTRRLQALPGPMPIRRGLRKVAASRKSTSFGETTTKEIEAVEKRSRSIEGILQRASSTPDLLEIGPEAEDLLMEDDKTLLQRMRTALHALRFMSDFKDCRYLRTSGTLQQVEQSSSTSQTILQISNRTRNNPTDDKLTKQRSEDDMDEDGEENIVFVETELSGEDAREKTLSLPRNCESENKQIGELNQSLNSSSSSTLAEMFEEIRNTRYLRIHSTVDQDVAVDVHKLSYGHNTPLIIVGHTKAVLTEMTNSTTQSELI